MYLKTTFHFAFFRPKKFLHIALWKDAKPLKVVIAWDGRMVNYSSLINQGRISIHLNYNIIFRNGVTRSLTEWMITLDNIVCCKIVCIFNVIKQVYFERQTGTPSSCFTCHLLRVPTTKSKAFKNLNSSVFLEKKCAQTRIAWNIS